MQNAAGDASAPPDARNDNYRAVVSDLACLIERVQASMQLVETAIAGESPVGNQEVGTNVIVLDDVTPRYLRANAALSACNASLGAALLFLLDTRQLHGAGDSAAMRDLAAVREVSRA